MWCIGIVILRSRLLDSRHKKGLLIFLSFPLNRDAAVLRQSGAAHRRHGMQILHALVRIQPASRHVRGCWRLNSYHERCSTEDLAE